MSKKTSSQSSLKSFFGKTVNDENSPKENG